MKREKLEEYLGKNVTIKIFDGSVISGVLYKTGEDLDDEVLKRDFSLKFRKNLYFLEPERKFLFRCSHVKTLKEN